MWFYSSRVCPDATISIAIFTVGQQQNSRGEERRVKIDLAETLTTAGNHDS